MSRLCLQGSLEISHRLSVPSLPVIDRKPERHRPSPVIIASPSLTDSNHSRILLELDEIQCLLSTCLFAAIARGRISISYIAKLETITLPAEYPAW